MTTILRDASIIVNGSDLSHHSQELAVDMTANTIETTTVGARGRSFEQGTIDGVFTVRFLQNITVVHQVLQPLLATAAAFPVSVSIPGSPVFSMSAEMFRYQPITGVVGEVAGIDVEFVGTITIFDNNITVTGARAEATATGQSGGGTGSDGTYGSGIYGAGPYGGTFTLTVTGVRASAAAASRRGTVGAMPIIGGRASATATAQAGTSDDATYGSGVYSVGPYGGTFLLTVTGVRASAAAAGRPGSVRIMPIIGVRGAATAVSQHGVVSTMPITGVSPSATAATHPGGVGMLTPWVSANATITGVRAAATAASQPGVVQIMPIVGVRATATGTAQSGFVAIMPIPGVGAAATTTAQPGGDGMLTAWDGPVV